MRVSRTKEKDCLDSSAVDPIVRYGWVLILLLIVIPHKAILRIFFGTVIVSKDEIGIVNKKWVLFGKNRTLPDGGSGGHGGTLVDVLLANLIRDHMKPADSAPPAAAK